MVTGDPVDLNLTMSPPSRQIPALLTKNSAQPCQIESFGKIMWIRERPIDNDDDDDEKVRKATKERKTLLLSFSVGK